MNSNYIILRNKLLRPLKLMLWRRGRSLRILITLRITKRESLVLKRIKIIRRKKKVHVITVKSLATSKNIINFLRNKKKFRTQFCGHDIEIHVLEYDNAWWIDSNATKHVCKDHSLFTSYKVMDDRNVLYVGNSFMQQLKEKAMYNYSIFMEKS